MKGVHLGAAALTGNRPSLPYLVSPNSRLDFKHAAKFKAEVATQRPRDRDAVPLLRLLAAVSEHANKDVWSLLKCFVLVKAGLPS